MWDSDAVSALLPVQIARQFFTQTRRPNRDVSFFAHFGHPRSFLFFVGDLEASVSA